MQKQSLIRSILMLAPLVLGGCTYEEAPLSDAGRFEFEGRTYSRAWVKKYIKWTPESGNQVCFNYSGTDCQIADKHDGVTDSYEKKSCRLSTSSTSSDFRFKFFCLESGTTSPCKNSEGVERESTSLLQFELEDQPPVDDAEFTAATWGSDSSVTGTVVVSSENICEFAATE
jgi:hypothetical protein